MLANWVSETTSTVVTSSVGAVISMGGASSADLMPFSAAFATGDMVQVMLKQGNNRQSIIGTLTSGTPWTLTVDNIFEKWDGGVHTLNPSTGISLTGTATVEIDVSTQMLQSTIKPQGAANGYWQIPQNIGMYTYAGKPGGEYTNGTNKILFLSVIFSSPQIINKMGVLITTAGAAGALTRLAIYAPDKSTKLPSTLIADSGSIVATATGFSGNTLPSPIVVPPGQYYLADFANDSSIVAYGARQPTAGQPMHYDSTNTGGKFTYSQAFGAFPATLTAGSLTWNSWWASHGHFYQ
jgi:hypothetical protein